MTTYDRLKEQCQGSSSSECQTVNRMGGFRSGMPTDDPNISASKVVANYDINGNVVSYVLIDRSSNQATMIMEPLEYAAYRNAPAGIQAMMQLSPQYALDFASSGLYSSAGDYGRAAENLIAGLTSRDYIRDVFLGVVGSTLTTSAAGKVKAGVNKPFPNLEPAEQIIHPVIFPVKQIQSVSYSGKLNYVVTESGELIIGKTGHISLSQGGDVLAAGEARFVNGNLRLINNSSGHYRPNGASAQSAAEKAFNKAGFDATGKYKEIKF
ncbi:hypothetical protein [Dechloromonas denitrificans]|uniref:hypothetical protein n=1 Tax=Dechloromonas denitrificans TaxID=281362 RepID=UPI001CFC45B9|nr:hypothetical protein [Dechloromonas denitrificans]UCV08561.1 hypothetical protein KI615_03245 [Dechloromonas denitrificans]